MTPPKTRMAKGEKIARANRKKCNALDPVERQRLQAEAVKIINSPKARMAKTRSKRTESGLCIDCGAPVAIRIITDSDGVELERKKLRRCSPCLLRIRGQ